MARGNGKQSQQAQASGRLSAFVKPKDAKSTEQSDREYVDWGEINDYYVVGAIKAVVREGGALLLGCSRDKSSYSVKVYSGGDGTAYYFPCSESGVADCEAFLLALSEIHSHDA